MIIFTCRTLSFVLQDKLLVKFSSQYHPPTKLTFANNQHKFDSSSSEDVFKTSSRPLDQDEYVRLSLTSSEGVFKTSSRRLGQDQYIRLGYTSSIRLQDVFKTSSRRFQNIFKTSSKRLQDVLKNVFKTSSRCLQDVSSS